MYSRVVATGDPYAELLPTVEREETGDSMSVLRLPLTRGEFGVDRDSVLLLLPRETKETFDRDLSDFAKATGSAIMTGADGQIDSSSMTPAGAGTLDRRLLLLCEPWSRGVMAPEDIWSTLRSLRMLICRTVSNGLSVASRVGFD